MSFHRRTEKRTIHLLRNRTILFALDIRFLPVLTTENG
jgi:hypothetical protein